MPQNESSSEKSQRQSRPWNITVLSIFVLIISLFHLLKLIQVITQWEMLPSLPTGAFWIDLIWVSEPEQLQTRWLINLVFTALGLAAVFLSLNLTISRIFFSGNPAKN
jgi:hypothetical protein